MVLRVPPKLEWQVEVEEPACSPSSPYAFNATGPLEEEDLDAPPMPPLPSPPAKSFFRLSMASTSLKAPKLKRRKASGGQEIAPEWR